MTSDTIDYFMSLKDGANYVVIYQMLCLKTINTNGRLLRTIGEMKIPYDVPKIQRDLKWFSANTIRSALSLFESFGLIYEDENGVPTLTNYSSLVGSNSDYSEQKSRQRQTDLEYKNVDNGVYNVHTTAEKNSGINVDKSVDIDVDNVHTNVHTENRDKEKRDKDIDIDIQEREHKKEKEADGADAPAEQSCPFSEIKRLYRENREKIRPSV